MEDILRAAIPIGLKITITLLMLSLGLRITRRALTSLWRNPRLLAGSLAAAFLVVPVATFLVFKLLPLSFGTMAGLWAVAITPGAPMLHRAAMKRAIGNPELAASFQVTVALGVIVFAPAWLAVISAITGGDYGIAPRVILKQVSTIQFIPLLAGMALRHWLPGFADRMGPVLTKIGNSALLAFAVILLAVLGLKIVAGVRIWTVVAASLVAASAIIGGHLLAGPDLVNRITIANADAQRNPGLALTIVASSVPEHHGPAIVAVVLYMIVAIVMIAVYTRVYGKSVSQHAA